MKKILLIRPPERNLPYRSRPMTYLPIGLLSIAAVLMEEGHKVVLVDGLMPGGESAVEADNVFGISFEEIKKRVSCHDFDIAGISAQFSYQWANAARVCQICKELNPGCRVVVGGAHISVDYENILRANKYVDMAVRGEGEKVFPEIVKNVRLGKSCSELPGVAVRSERGATGRDAEPVEDLDSLPLPAYDLVDMERYFSLNRKYFTRTAYQFPGWERGVSVITSRGCPFNCVFCSIHLHMGKKWRAHSAGYVLRHIKFLRQNYGVRYIHFEDDNLTLDAKRFEAILDGISADFPGMRWDTPNGVRADTFNDNLLKKCRDTGCTHLIFGIESGVQRVIDEVIDKRIKLPLIESVLYKAKKTGIDTRAFFIIGFPGETKEDIKSTVDYAVRIMFKYDCFGGFAMAAPLLGTRLYRICGDNDYFYLDPTIDNIAASYTTSGIIRTKHFDPDYLAKMIGSFNKRASRLLLLIFLKKLLRDFSLFKYVFLRMATTSPLRWSGIYYKAIMFHHAVIYDIKKKGQYSFK
jgi:radical SAM superfamily enzyme YgiQ (UPF0313 family)